MTNRNQSFICVMIIALIILVIFIGFLASFSEPVAWVLIAALLMIPIFYKKATDILSVAFLGDC